MTIPAELKPEQVVALVDRREQLPVCLDPLQVEPATLRTGDYTYKGGELTCAIERKSLEDLLACVGRERERFDAEIQRLLAFETRAIVVETTWEQLENGGWRSHVQPSAAIGSCLGWIARGVPMLFVGNHERAGQYIGRLLFTCARRRWREARHLVGEVKSREAATA